MSLTSFEKFLLDFIVTAVISACIFKKTYQISEFLCSHFTEDGTKYTIFLTYYALLFQER